MADPDGEPSSLAATMAEAAAARRRGDLGSAFQLLNAALFEVEAAGESGRDAVPRIQLELGRTAAGFGDHLEARSWFERALEADDPGLLGDLELELGRLDARAGFGGDARRHLRQAAAGYTAIADGLGTARVHLELADLYAAAGDGTIARLELGAAAALATSPDPADPVERLVVSARVRAVLGDRDGAADDLRAALGVDPGTDVDAGASRAGEVRTILEAWLAGELAMPDRFPSAATTAALDGAGFTFPSIVVGRDGMIGEAAIIDASELDPDMRAAASRFVAGAVRRTTGRPIAGEPRIEVEYSPDAEVFGIAYVTYLVGAAPTAGSIVATGADPRDHAQITRNDNFVSFLAGRHATDTYVGFSRYAALRPGALAAVTERPVAFFVPFPGVPEALLRASHDRHLALSAAFIAMVQEDGDAARRLRLATKG